MYSESIEKILKEKGVSVGSRIRLTVGKDSYEGLLMPRTGAGDENVIVLKLDNGYNIGIECSAGARISKVKGSRKIAFKHAKSSSAKDPTKPTISVLGCGGTIGSRIEYSTGAVFPSFSPDDLVLSFPEIKEIANIKGSKLFDLFSEDMTAEHWKIIAKDVVKEIKSKADGVVLMHGTDTMHFTSAALSFMVQNPTVPVVLVGSQRSSDRGSSDNAMNFVCSSVAASSDIAEVGVCMHASMNDDYCYLHQGTKVRKMHTSRRDTFRSINASPFGKVWYGSRKMDIMRTDYKGRGEGKLELDDKINQRVCLLYTYPGMDSKMVEFVAGSYDGLVIAGTGLGHVPTNPDNSKFSSSIMPAVSSLIERGIPVVIAPQTIYGRLNLNVYKAGRIMKDAGVIGHGCDWTPETALVKLMWVLGHTNNLNKVRDMMMKNVAGEISERSGPEEFLL